MIAFNSQAPHIDTFSPEVRRLAERERFDYCEQDVPSSGTGIVAHVSRFVVLTLVFAPVVWAFIA